MPVINTASIDKVLEHNNRTENTVQVPFAEPEAELSHLLPPALEEFNPHLSTWLPINTTGTDTIREDIHRTQNTQDLYHKETMQRLQQLEETLKAICEKQAPRPHLANHHRDQALKRARSEPQKEESVNDETSESDVGDAPPHPQRRRDQRAAIAHGLYLEIEPPLECEAEIPGIGTKKGLLVGKNGPWVVVKTDDNALYSLRKTWITKPSQKQISIRIHLAGTVSLHPTAPQPNNGKRPDA